MKTLTAEQPRVRESNPLDDYLGPAEALRVAPTTVLVSVGGHTAIAQLALAFAYEPAVGDMLLVTAKRGRAYVIGVLSGTGKAKLAIAGDVEISAVGGALRLSGDEGVYISGKHIRLAATEKLRLLADDAVQTFSTLTRRVRGLFSSQLGEKLETVEGSRIERAKQATVLTEETMAINGREIHLG